MKRIFLMVAVGCCPLCLLKAQQSLHHLTVDQIMQDPKWIGSSPSNLFWSPDSKRIFFDWNPDAAESDSLYYYSLESHSIFKADPSLRDTASSEARGSYSPDRNLLAYCLKGNLLVLDALTGRSRLISWTSQPASDPHFLANTRKVVFTREGNLYLWNGDDGSTRQLTNFQLHAPVQAPEKDAQADFLERDALGNSQVLRQRTVRIARRDSLMALELRKKSPRIIYTDGQDQDELVLSPDEHYISYRLSKEAPGAKHVIVPEFVTASGYTEELQGREKVGTPESSYSSFIYDPARDTIYPIHTEDIPGIRDLPDYLRYYPGEDSLMKKTRPLRQVVVLGPFWNQPGTRAFVVVRALDHKDRWILSLDPRTGRLSLMDRQRDEAWVDGPGIGWDFGEGNLGWISDSIIWFQSEATGYSELYSENIRTGEKKALTSGKFEVFQAELSRDRRSFFLNTNEVEPGQRQGYRLEIATGKITRLTGDAGGYELTPSPDNRWIALRYSSSNHPWEASLQLARPGAEPIRITDKAETPLFASYPWRAPELVRFRDRDGLEVFARLFRPSQQAASRPGVLFIHGAGYLQDAIQYWSDDYFREYLFENLLTDEGYTVMDIDYRGSAGYGRDWRTAIYRHMGGKDLDDIVDGAAFMKDSLNVAPARIGVWGGSYGGFLTLMALFTDPGTFACGAALRSVTDWAHYNQGYTSDILNEPATDSLAYLRSSPIYFAAGLRDHLLMCHGMQDTNVNFQDIVRLTEKLIELGKRRWSLAVYPLENHGFADPSSWQDEYNRIHDLFTGDLLQPAPSQR